MTGAALDGRALWREARFRGALALAVVALLSAFPRPDLAHINFVLPLACRRAPCTLGDPCHGRPTRRDRARAAEPRRLSYFDGWGTAQSIFGLTPK